MPLECAAAPSACGTVTGWRYGGRCWRCRTARNAENRRWRGLSPDERAVVFAALSRGASPSEAADEAGVTERRLANLSQQDSELRAALDGAPKPVQDVSRKGDYLHALIRARGDRALAAAAANVSPAEVEEWSADPSYCRVEEQVSRWVKSALREAGLVTAAELLSKGASLRTAASAAGTTPSRLREHASAHPELQKHMPPPKTKTPTLTEVESEFRRLWADPALTAKQIARQFGVEPPALNSWAQRLGLVRASQREAAGSPVEEDQLRHAAQLLREGASISDAARAVGLTPAGLRWHSERHAELGAAIPPPRAATQRKRPTKRTAEVERKFCRMWAEPGRSVSSISRDLGIAEPTLRAWADKLGLPPGRERLSAAMNRETGNAPGLSDAGQPETEGRR